MTNKPQCQMCGMTTNLYSVTAGTQTNYACPRHLTNVIEAEVKHSSATGITVKRIQNVN